MVWILKNLSLTKGYFGKNSKSYQNVTKIYSVGFSHDADHDGKRIKQSDWPWKFWGCRVFHYSWVGVVLPLSVNKWPNLHPSDPPHPPPPTKFLHSPHENLMAMKVCCRQKNFSPPLKFWKFLLAIDCFCWSLPICKKSNLLFWITLDTTGHIHLKWLNKCDTSIASLPHAKN